jgi:predicted glycosyltransferase
MNSKNFLFFIVHPSKFHVFRNTINHLKKNGHHVDILITQKDVLEDLVQNEGWEYKNLFPNGRSLKPLHSYLNIFLFFIFTILKLFLYTRKKSYDLFITDDLLVYIGKLKRVPTIVINDSDINVVKQFALILQFTDYCLTPAITDLGRFNQKKIAYDGYKELAYLHPNWFRADKEIREKYIKDNDQYFIIRLVSLSAYHDVGMKGLNDKNVLKLIGLLKKFGTPYICSERSLTDELEKYRLKVCPSDFIHILAGASLFIGDSQTTTSEASILGVPSFRFNDFVGKIKVMEEKEIKYGLSFNYRTADFDRMYDDIRRLLKQSAFRQVFHKRRSKLLNEKIDLSSFMIWLFENFPQSIKEFHKDPQIQNRFKFKIKSEASF